MEKIQETEQTIEVFENDIDMYLRLFCEEQGIEDMRSVPQAIWNAALMYIKRRVFNTPDILKSHVNIINNNSIMDSTYNAYDYNLVLDLCNYYIYICNMYNKGVTISGFSKLTGIGEETIYDWGREDSRKLSTRSSEIYKKLSTEYENSLEAKLWSNKHPVAHMAIANKRFGWNLPGVSKEQTNSRALSASELPKLGGELSEKRRLVDGENE